MTGTELHPFDSARSAPAPPYPPSWVDRILAAVQRNRIPNLVFYVSLFVVGHALATALRIYQEGKSLQQVLTMPPPIFLIWSIYLLALMQYLNAVARDKIRELRPALDVDDETFAVLGYRLTVMPAREALLSGLFWLVVAIGMFWYLLPSVRAFGYLDWEIACTIATYMIGGTAVYHTVHQLRTVSELHRMVKRIDLYDLDPLYTMSGLTARTGAGLVLLIYITFVLLPRQLATTAFGGTLVVVVVLAAAAFVAPLTGIHRRLEAEKKRAVNDVNQRLKRILAEIHGRIDRQQIEGLDPLQKAVSGLLAERDILNKISTWPWQAATLRGFVSALVLPVMLKVAQDVLKYVMDSMK